MKSIYSLFVRGYQVNPTETDRKGLTELSEINLARPFLLAFFNLYCFQLFAFHAERPDPGGSVPTPFWDRYSATDRIPLW